MWRIPYDQDLWLVVSQVRPSYSPSPVVAQAGCTYLYTRKCLQNFKLINERLDISRFIVISFNKNYKKRRTLWTYRCTYGWQWTYFFFNKYISTIIVYTYQFLSLILVRPSFSWISWGFIARRIQTYNENITWMLT